MRFIDFHCHVYPDAIAAKAADNVRQFYDGLGNPIIDGKVQTLLERGVQAGVHEFVILPVAVQASRTRHINNFIIEQVEKQPCFYGYGTIHADMQDLTEEVQYIMDMGLRGIKMHPDYQLFNIDDPRLFPVYEMAGENLPFIFHMGDQRYDYSHPARLRHVLELFPKLQVIAAHFGGYSMYQEAYEILKDTHCIFDISSSMMFMPEGEPEKYINAYGAERMAFGSDYPLWDPVEEVERFLRLRLTAEQLEQIAHKTAERFLHL